MGPYPNIIKFIAGRLDNFAKILGIINENELPCGEFGEFGEF